MHVNKLIIGLVAIGQIFAAGMVFQTKLEWSKDIKERLKAVLYSALVLFFGIALLAICIIAMVLGGLYFKIVDGLHLGFMLKYMVFKQPLEFDALKYKVINAKADKMRPKWYQFGDKIFIYCVRWAIKERERQLLIKSDER